MHKLAIPNEKLNPLESDPARSVIGRINGATYKLNVAIPNYAHNVAEHYTQGDRKALAAICERADIPFDFEFFGLVCTFQEPIELCMYDENKIMDDDVRMLIERFGAIIVKNAYLNSRSREDGHRAKFKHLNFHYDRGAHQEEQHSLYSRDPFDAEQVAPRESSTLFIANIVACLQSMKEAGAHEAPEGQGVLGSYQIFNKERVADHIGRFVVEHRWDEPHGTGEISALNNRTALHSSYYRNASQTSYRIAVRYLK